MVGGPRAGKGDAVRAAMCALGMLRKAYASGWAGCALGRTTGGGAQNDAHRGQSMLELPNSVALPSSA